jgi:O-antigen/teichoic acid export membrane protein
MSDIYADDLEMGASQFHRSGESTRRRTWWQLTKFRIFMFVLVLLFVSTLTGIMNVFVINILASCMLGAILFWKRPRNIKGTPIDNRDTEQGPDPLVESGPDP